MGTGKRNKDKRSGQESGTRSYFAEQYTCHIQKEIHNSEFRPKMVTGFGEQKAEELLRQCKAELKGV